MINSLYECFQNWSIKGSVYLISDTHFGHLDMNWRCSEIEESFEDIVSEEEKANRLANYIVQSINKVATKNDTLIILGDVGDVSYISKLKAGHKVLIKGNHDKGDSVYLRKIGCLYAPETKNSDELKKEIQWFKKTFKSGFIRGKEGQKIACYDNNLFDEVYSGPLMISEKILLSHEPIKGPWFNIHGHCHDRNYINTSDELNISCEKINFTPVSLKKITESGILKNIDSIHRITIDKASKK